MAKKEEWQDAGKSSIWDYKAEGKGAVLQGIFVKVETDVGPNKSNLYTFDVEGEKIQMWGSTLMDIRLSNIEVGEEVKITYLGEEKSDKRAGANYHNFEVLHRMPETIEHVEIDIDKVK